jgi:PTS system mannose-specific IID component
MSGSLLGPLLFFILFNAVRLLTRYYGVAYGYRKGWTSLRTWAAASCRN